jgi:hypothetical protein
VLCRHGGASSAGGTKAGWVNHMYDTMAALLAAVHQAAAKCRNMNTY